MGIFDLFSKRQRRQRGDFPDTYQYDVLPKGLRVQIVQILQETYTKGHHAQNVFKLVHDILCKEHQTFRLADNHEYGDRYDGSILGVVFNYFLRQETDRALDVVELLFRIRSEEGDGPFSSNDHMGYSRTRVVPIVDAIDELNHRFKEHGVGYSFEAGEIVRRDSEFLHQEAVRPMLALLANKAYKVPNEEFLSAHEHYRHKRYEEALADCLKAFESTMKVICDKRKWQHNVTDTASRLLQICYDHKLVPDWIQSELGALKSTLESGIPTIRNRMGGHGAGSIPRDVPEHLVSYALHLTASSILYLVQCERNTK